ncbi:hypothetical protein AHAS_Ahas13G0302800 [Arachis hypogaea]
MFEFCLEQVQDGHIRIMEWPSMNNILDEPRAHKSVRDMDFRALFLLRQKAFTPQSLLDTTFVLGLGNDSGIIRDLSYQLDFKWRCHQLSVRIVTKGSYLSLQNKQRFCPRKPVPESILVSYVGRKNVQKAIIESILRTLFYSHQSIPITTVTRFCASRASLESLSFGNTNANQNHSVEGKRDDALDLLNANSEVVKDRMNAGSKGIQEAAILDVLALGYVAVGHLKTVASLLNVVEKARRYIPREFRLAEAFGNILGGFFLASYEDSPTGVFDERAMLVDEIWHAAGDNASDIDWLDSFLPFAW